MTIVHWIHAIAGALWAGAAGAFAIAAAALPGRSARDGFAMRVAPRLSALGAAAAAILVGSGIANLISAARIRDFQFAPEFVGVLAAKAALFAAMVALLIAGSRPVLRRRLDVSEESRGAARLMRINGAIAAMGVIALGLGVWLMGS